METKIFNSFNQIVRNGRGLNLNLFRYAAMVVVWLILGVGTAWGGHSNHTGKVTLVNATGNGTVYLSTSSSSNSGQSSSSNPGTQNGTSVITWSCGEDSSKDAKTLYPRGTANAGYYYAGWTAANNSTSGYSTSSYSANAQSDTDKKLYGYFKPVTVTGASANVTINVTDETAVYPTDASARTLSFTTANSNALTDFTYSPANGTTGKFTFSEWTRVSATQVTVKYQFQGSAGDWGGVSRTIEQNVTLTSKGTGGGSATCKITVIYPNVKITDVTADETINVTYDPTAATQPGVVKTVVFDVEYCDGTNNFDTPTFSGAGASHFGNVTTSYANGKLTVNYTYSGNKEEGEHVATLTLKAKDAIGGTDATYGSKSVTITAQNAPIAADDAKVIAANGVTQLYKGTWAEALAEANKVANAGCTLWLLRDVTGLNASQEVKNTFTLDLNSFTLSGTLSAAGGLLKLNTAGKTLTITDAVSGGTISASGNIDGRISAIEVLKGKLTLTKGNLVAQNSNTGATEANIYVASAYVASGAEMEMTGGSITANRTGASGNYCYGIYGDATSTLNLSNSTITATFANGGYAQGVRTLGNATINNMTISASSKIYSYAIWDANGHVVVNGGTYTGTTSANGARALYSKTAPATTGSLVVSNATLYATAATTDAKGVYCQSTSTTTNDDPTAPNITLSGLTVTAKTDGTTKAYAIYTDAGVSLLVNSGTYTATSKTTDVVAVSSAGYTAIVNGTFTANATTIKAWGIRVEGGITAVKNGTITANATTEQAHGTYVAKGKLLVYGGTFKGYLSNAGASKTASGTLVYTDAEIEAHGGTFIGEVAKTGLSAAQTTLGIGMYIYSGAKASSLTNVTLRGQTDNTYVNGAYALKTETANPVSLTSCTLQAVSAYQYGYGVHKTATPLDIKNSTITVNTTYAYNYGLHLNGAGTVSVSKSTFTATSGTTSAYGAYVGNGSLVAENCTFNATTNRTGASSAGDCNLFGVNVNTGKTATLTGCTINATGSGQYSNNGYGVYVNGTADIEECTVNVSGINSGAYAIYNTDNTTRIGVGSGKFKATATSTGISTNGTAAAAKQQLYGGYYNTKNNLEKYLPAGYCIETLENTSTEYGQGYRYAIRPGSHLSPVCKIGSTPYYSLEEALEFVNKNSGTEYTILMVDNYTLPAGDYTLPAKATLLVPKSGQTSLETHPTRVYNSYSYPTCNLKLTFASGAHLDVLGKIQTGGTQSAKGQIAQEANTANNGMPTGNYGWLYLSEGSTIALESGSQLYAWGYVTGPGEIDAKRGSTVHEFFQIKDWRGGSCTSSMNGNGQKVFPLNQYYIQNVESPIKFRPGSSELCDGTVNAGSDYRDFNDVKLIGVNGSGSMFEMANEDMSEDTWVRKWYDAVNDKQVYEINSSASIGSVSLKLYAIIKYITFTSSEYVLPLTNNMKIHLLTGEMYITNNTELLPGAEIEIDKEATAYINSGKSLYVFDIDQWNPFYTNEHTFPLPYSPSWAGSGKTCPRSRKVTEDAKVNVHGKFVVNGGIYTTASGANIFSTDDDAGTIQFNVDATSGTSSVYVANNTGPTYTERPSNSAYLKNGDGTYEHTGGTVSGKSWIYYDNKWNCWEERDCFGYDEQDHPYGKPRAWVQLTSNVADATDHLFRDAETGDRRFLLDNCTWWEVEPTPYSGNKYKCVDPDHNGKYKYYEYVNNKWQEAVVTVTWMNGSTTLATYNKTLYGTHPTYLDANPTKSATSAEYYSWIGWLKDDSENGEFYAKDAELPFAYANTTYYALFETHKYSYAVLFKNFDGSYLQSTSWEAGQVPYYSGETPEKPATAAKEYTFTGWSPSTFSAVSGSGSVYTAQFAESDREYTVQWVDYDGTVLKEEEVVYNSTPTPPAAPARPNDSYYTYTFDAWSPATSAVTSNQTYTATYTYEKKVTKYDINFKNGSSIIYTLSLPNGEYPVYGGSTPTKDDAEYDYTFDGWSDTEGGSKLDALHAVSGPANYFAVFTHIKKKYTIRWKSEDGKVLYETDNNVPYGATPEYNSATPTKPRQGATIYTFDGWSSTIGGAKIALPTVTGHATYYAHFSDLPVHTVTFNANGHGTAPASQEVVHDQHVLEPAAPTADGFVFGGWYKEAGCTNAWNFATDVITADRSLFAKWTPAVATVTVNDVTTPYLTLNAAIDAANGTSNATVKMLQSVTITSQIDLTATMTINLNSQTITATQASATGAFRVNASGKTVTITDSGTGGKIDHTASYLADKSYMYGIYVTAGSLSVESGTVYAKNTAANRAYGIYTDGSASSITVSGSGVVTAESSTSPFGIYSNKDGCTLTMNGGTFIANGAGSRGIYMKGATTLTNATITATGSSAYAIFAVSGDMTINSGTYTATGASNNLCIYHRKNVITINGGYFNTTNKLYTKDTGSSEYNGTITLQGGYYNKDTELEAKCASGYHVLPNADASYPYKVAQAYTVTFNANGHGTAPASQYVEPGQKATAPTAPTADGYDFGGWYKEAGCENAWNFSSDVVTAATTLYAKWTVSIVDRELEIVKWTSTSLTINANGLKTAAGTTDWKINVVGKEGKNDYQKGDRNSDRTLTIDGLTLAGGSDLTIQLKKDNGSVESRHTYTVPYINAIKDASESSTVYVTDGSTLTVDANKTIANLYVCPGAQVNIASGKTLTVTGKLVLRTKPWQTAAINGAVEAGLVFYTRIGPDGSDSYKPSQYYQFGLPYSCAISAVSLSDGSTPVYVDTWILKKYNEENRSKNGTDGNNWDVVSSEGTIEAGVGYEMFSSMKYYREYYFPVTPTDNTSVHVTRHGSSDAHSGWNIVCSPLMSVYGNESDPVTGIKVSWLLADGSYDQLWPETIWPALPFSYQAPQEGYLDFSTSDFKLGAPRRRNAYSETVETEWIHLDVINDDEQGDHTSIFVHPDRFEPTYETGIDVAKQSFTASRALIYSSHAYGEMAFAGVSDELLEKGVALTIYSPSAQSLTISMRENDWLNRMEYVWLIDKETGIRTDLLTDEYSFSAAEGTTAGRFFIEGVFAPKVATDIPNDGMMNDESRMARKLLIDDKIYIDVNGRRYDATGKLVNDK